jgi:regulator of protease activity HflC (stomatin/prohibitin superfamily)
MKFKANKKQTFSLLGLLLITFGLFTIVPANNVGIIYSPFSGVSQNTLSEGIHGKGLFSKVYKISTEIQTKKLKDISGQTKDSQFVTLTADVKYKVDNAKAFEVFKQYRNLKNISNDLITPVVQRSIESVTTQYNIIDVLGAERNNVYKQIEADLKTRLEANGITFILINFDDTDAGDEIEAAIQREAIAKKDAETAEQQRLKNLLHFHLQQK